MVILKSSSIGVVAKDRLDYQRWVLSKSKDVDIRYFAIIEVSDLFQSYDEIVITSNAQANPNYVDIYIKLNGAYAKAKRESRIAI